MVVETADNSYGNGFPECFLPARTENKHPWRAASSTLHWGKAGVLFISSFFLLLRHQLCEFCGHQINSYSILSLQNK